MLQYLSNIVAIEILLPDCYCIYLSEKEEACKLQISGRHEEILAGFIN